MESKFDPNQRRGVSRNATRRVDSTKTISSRLLPSCAVCNTPGATLCIGCGLALYYSEVCKNDAGYYQSACTRLKAFLDKGKPRNDAKLGLQFPEAPFLPHLIWYVQEGEKLVEVRDRFQVLQYNGLLGGHVEVVELFLLKSRRSLNHSITLCSRPECNWDGISENNLSIWRFTNGQHKYDWRGPMTLISQPGRLRPLGYQDVTLADLFIFRDFLLSYGDGLEESLRRGGLRALELKQPLLWEQTMLRFEPKEMIWGVKISCVGDMKVLGVDQYVAVKIPRNHPIYANEDPNACIHQPPAPIGLSVIMECPLLVRRTAVDWRWWNYFPSQSQILKNQDSTNELAALLTAIVDLDHPDWGENCWQNNSPYISGTVLVTRPDKLPLMVPHLQAMVNTIQSFIAPLMARQKALERMAPEEKTSIRVGREYALWLAAKHVSGITLGRKLGWERLFI